MRYIPDWAEQEWDMSALETDFLQRCPECNEPLEDGEMDYCEKCWEGMLNGNS